MTMTPPYGIPPFGQATNMQTFPSPQLFVPISGGVSPTAEIDTETGSLTVDTETGSNLNVTDA